MMAYVFHQFVVHHILVLMVLAVVDMQVPEGVDIEIHLVVGTEPVMIYSEQCHIGKDIVY